MRGAPPRTRLTKFDLHTLYAVTAKNWSAEESVAYVRIVWRESTGNPWCTNPRSSSAGLYGFLSSTRAKYGVTLESPLSEQSDAFLRYCTNRYGSVSNAWAHHRRKGWF